MYDPNAAGKKIAECQNICKIIFEESCHSCESESVKFSFLNWNITPKTEKNAVITVKSNDAETEICG